MLQLKQEILREHSKANSVAIAHKIGNNQRQFGQLIHLMLGEDILLSQRAAWVLNFCMDNHPDLIYPQLKKIFTHLRTHEVHDAVRRNTIRLLQFIRIPVALEGLITDTCFRLLVSKTEPVAVKVYCMETLYRICRKEPLLANELCLIIESLMTEGSPGIRSRGRKILQALQHK